MARIEVLAVLFMPIIKYNGDIGDISLLDMQFFIITVGKTHSGKTTFGKKVAKRLKHACLLDSDVIAEFLSDNFPDLYNKDFVEGSNELSSGYSLKISVLLDIYKQSLKTKLPIISTSANSSKHQRAKNIGLARKAGRKVIMIYFNLPESLLLERIKTSKRSDKCLYYSKSFVDLLINKQGQRFDVPSQKEADYFFEITDEPSSVKAYKSVLKILNRKI